MSVQIEGLTTTVKPTPWKWFGLAISLFFLATSLINDVAPSTGGLLQLMALFCFVLGTGKFHYIELRPEGFSHHGLLSKGSYTWEEVSGLSPKIIRTSPFFAVKSISFIIGDAPENMLQKFSNAINGRTKSMGVIGMEPKALVQMMRVYQTAPDRQSLEMLLRELKTTEYGAEPIGKFSSPEPVSKNVRPQSPKKVQKEPARLKAMKKKVALNQSSPKIEKKAPSRKPLAPAPSTPLVQEGFKLFGRRPQN